MIVNPIHYVLDRMRSAPKITCEICNICTWREPKNSTFCEYGGPYVGYDELQFHEAVASSPMVD